MKGKFEMSISMYVTSERQYWQFINEISDDTTIDEIFDRLDKISYYTNFSVRLERLYDVVDGFERFEDDFTEERSYAGFKTSVEDLESTLESLNSREVFIKWDPVIDLFEDEDNILIFIDV